MQDKTSFKLFPDSVPQKLRVGFYGGDVFYCSTADLVWGTLTSFSDNFDVHLFAVDKTNPSAKNHHNFFNDKGNLNLFLKTWFVEISVPDTVKFCSSNDVHVAIAIVSCVLVQQKTFQPRKQNYVNFAEK